MKIETLEKTMEEMRATVSELQEQISALYGKMMFLILLHFKCIMILCQYVGYMKNRYVYWFYIFRSDSNGATRAVSKPRIRARC